MRRKTIQLCTKIVAVNSLHLQTFLCNAPPSVFLSIDCHSGTDTSGPSGHCNTWNIYSITFVSVASAAVSSPHPVGSLKMPITLLHTVLHHSEIAICFDSMETYWKVRLRVLQCMKTVFVDAVLCEILCRRCQRKTPRHGDLCVLQSLSKIVRSSNA